MQWLCCKCDSINVSSFTYHTYELGNDTSYYEPLTTPANFTESFTSKFSPLKTSSPKSLKANDTQEYSMKRSNSRNQTANHQIPKKRNIRMLAINCRSIKDKTSELKTTIDYAKPDIIISTESWLEGIKPEENPTKDAIKSSEIFLSNYTAYRNDRGSLAEGVFIEDH